MNNIVKSYERLLDNKSKKAQKKRIKVQKYKIL